jgi:hypothetical protein
VTRARDSSGASPSLRTLPRAADLLPWRAVNVSVYPFASAGSWWPFNPSVHRDPIDGAWRCVVRLANYTLPDGVPHLAPEARAGRARTRNVLLALDDATLAPVDLAEIGEPEAGTGTDLARAPTCTSLGLEDLRLFRTAADGLCVTGCALQYNLTHPSRPEIVVCRLGDPFRTRGVGPEGVPIVALDSVRLLRGEWGFRAQKNWVPFDDAGVVLLLYSIERGIVMTEDGPLSGSPPPVTPRPTAPASPLVTRPGRNAAEVRLFGRPTAATVQGSKDPLGSRRHDELRGGSQLVALPDGRWLGVGHEMTFSHGRWSKFYWHTFYALNPGGKLLERSPPLRLSGDHGIEFAAGLAIDGDRDRLVVSFGTDDHEAWVAETTASAVLALLRPVD